MSKPSTFFIVKFYVIFFQDSFIIDNGANGIWVWIGKHASSKERVEAMRNAYGFVKKKNYPTSTPVSRVVESGEPMEFKALFKNWIDKDLTTINNKNSTGIEIQYIMY